MPTLLNQSVEKNVKNSTKADIVRYITSASVGHCNGSGSGEIGGEGGRGGGGGGGGRGGGSTYPELYTAVAVLVQFWEPN